MSANWYDLLGVERDASSAQIRASWKASIADLDPTDHRFGLYNKAAGVLLDDDKRAAYDEELGPEEPDELEESDEPDESEDPAASENAQSENAQSENAESENVESDGNETDTAAESDPKRDGKSVPEGAPARFVLPVPVLALMLVATLVAAAGAFWLHHDSTDSDTVESNISAARDAAEQAVPKVLTYDYQYPDRDHDAAMQVLTGKIATSYDKIWKDAILPNLVKVKGAAETKVLGSGVVRSSDDAQKVELVVVLSSKTTNRKTSTQLPPIPMTVQMVDKDGEWLIDDMDLWQPASADASSGAEQDQKSGQN